MPNPFLLPGKWLADRRDRKASFDFDLAICAIFRNEARYLAEWLTFHEGVGVEHFYLYNDGSTDDFLDVIGPWIDRGMITLTEWTVEPQVAAYNHCIRRNRMDARWIAFIDLDEFLFSPTGCTLPEVMGEFADTSGVFVYWVLFGSSGHQNQPDQPVVEAYTSCLGRQSALADTFDHGKTKDRTNYVTGWSRDGKSIVNPRRVRFQNVHQPKRLWSGAVVDELGQRPRQRRKDCQLPYDKLRINHYWSKSLSEFRAKVERGSIANRARPPRNLSRWLERERMLNSSTDATILPIWERIRKAAASEQADG